MAIMTTWNKQCLKENLPTPISLILLDLCPFDAFYAVYLWLCWPSTLVMWAELLSVCCVCNIDGLVDKTLMDYTIIARNTRPRERERETGSWDQPPPVSSFRLPRDSNNDIQTSTKQAFLVYHLNIQGLLIFLKILFVLQNRVNL